MQCKSVLRRCAPSQRCASSHSNLLQSSHKSGQGESNTTFFMSIPWGKCAGSLKQSWCHLLCKSTSLTAPCPFPALGAALGTLLPQGTAAPQRFVTMVSHGSAFLLCIVKDLGFMFISLNRNQTQQSQLRNGCPPRVW